jgi:hypothetical protein
MRRPGFGCALLVMLLLLVPATASSLESATVIGDTSLTHYVGTKGVDDLTVSVEGPKWIFTRNAVTQEAPIAAGEQCADTSGGEQKTVACDLTEFTEIDLGEGADRLIGGAPDNELVVHAGPGQDLVTISSEESNLVDGEDDDDTFELGGGSGQDTISGSAGDDLFREPVGADTIIGGDGSDTVAYQLAPADSLTVTLDDQRNDGLSGDQNIHSDIEGLTGGQERDHFVGSAGANLIKGGQGNDEIDGGPGRDTLEGGEDEDQILARDGEPDTVDCGFGQDTATVDTGDTVSKCEVVYYPDLDLDGSSANADCDDHNASIRPGATDVPGDGIDQDCAGGDAPKTFQAPPVAASGSLKSRSANVREGAGSVSFRCRAPAGDSCSLKGNVLTQGKGKKIGTVAGKVGGGKTGQLTIHLNGTGTGLLAAADKLSAAIRATITNEAGARSPFNATIQLKPAPKPRPKRP